MIKYEVDTREIIDGLRMLRRVGMIGERRKAFIEIGVGLSARMKKNYLATGLRIRTGNLINSIGWELFSRADGEGVSVGSFGVPYAAIHEFGFSGRASVPGFVRGGHEVKSHSRTIRQAFGKPIAARKVQVRPYSVSPHNVKNHSRNMQVKERAFLRRSIAADRQRIYRLIAKAYGWGK